MNPVIPVPVIPVPANTDEKYLYRVTRLQDEIDAAKKLLDSKAHSRADAYAIREEIRTLEEKLAVLKSQAPDALQPSLPVADFTGRVYPVPDRKRGAAIAPDDNPENL